MAFLRVSSFVSICLMIAVIIPEALCDYQPFSGLQPGQTCAPHPRCSNNYLKPAIPHVEYILAIQWGPTVCIGAGNSPLCKLIKDLFTIHGLWKRGQRKCCTHPVHGQCFTAGLLSCFRRSVNVGNVNWNHNFDLDTYWVNAIWKVPSSLTTDQNNEKFWAREYKKHGRCCNTYVRTFFQSALDAYWSVDPVALTKTAWSKFRDANGGQKHALATDVYASLRNDLKNNDFVMICDGNQLLELRIRLSYSMGYWQILPNAAPQAAAPARPRAPGICQGIITVPK